MARGSGGKAWSLERIEAAAARENALKAEILRGDFPPEVKAAKARRLHAMTVRRVHGAHQGEGLSGPGNLTGFGASTRAQVVEKVNEVWRLSALSPYVPKDGE